MKVGIISRPQSGLSDFYREMGDLFGVELSPHNRWAGAKVLRDRWQAHIDAALSRPVLIADEAQEMKAAVLAELRLLSSARLDSQVLLTVVLAGDGRLLQRLRSDELSALNSRCRVRLALERARSCRVEAATSPYSGPEEASVVPSVGAALWLGAKRGGNPADSERFLPMLKRHIAFYGEPPRQTAADGGFASRDNLSQAKALGVHDVAFHKKAGLRIQLGLSQAAQLPSGY